MGGGTTGWIARILRHLGGWIGLPTPVAGFALLALAGGALVLGSHTLIPFIEAQLGLVWLSAPIEEKRVGAAPAAAPEPRPVPAPMPMPAPRPAPPPGANGDRPAPAPGAELDAALARLDRGTLAFNTPPRMRVGDTRQVQAILQPNVDIERLRGLITAAGRVEGAEIRVSSVMRALLEGSSFEILPSGGQEQAVSQAEPTQWVWNAKAKEAGTQVLTLSLFAVVTVDGRERPRMLKTFSRDIEVEIVPKSWPERLYEALEPWEKIAGALAAIGGVLWGFYAWWRKHMKRRRAARP